MPQTLWACKMAQQWIWCSKEAILKFGWVMASIYRRLSIFRYQWANLTDVVLKLLTPWHAALQVTLITILCSLIIQLKHLAQSYRSANFAMQNRCSAWVNLCATCYWHLCVCWSEADPVKLSSKSCTFCFSPTITETVAIQAAQFVICALLQ